jgi:hypothetical protein
MVQEDRVTNYLHFYHFWGNPNVLMFLDAPETYRLCLWRPGSSISMCSVPIQQFNFEDLMLGTELLCCHFIFHFHLVNGLSPAIIECGTYYISWDLEFTFLSLNIRVPQWTTTTWYLTWSKTIHPDALLVIQLARPTENPARATSKPPNPQCSPYNRYFLHITKIWAWYWREGAREEGQKSHLVLLYHASNFRNWIVAQVLNPWTSQNLNLKGII